MFHQELHFTYDIFMRLTSRINCEGVDVRSTPLCYFKKTSERDHKKKPYHLR
jgi:hypothetical protein